MVTLSGNFSMSAGTFTNGYASVNVTEDRGQITAESYGNKLSGDKTSMVALANGILTAAGVVANAVAQPVSAALDLTGFYGEQADTGEFLVYNSNDELVATFAPLPGTHRIVL
jgi:hypothetical protein